MMLIRKITATNTYSVYFVPESVLSTLHLLPHLIFITILGSRFYSQLCFKDEETETGSEKLTKDTVGKHRVGIQTWLPGSTV